MILRRQQGFTYVVAMFAVAVASIIATRAVGSAITEERRSREAELLYVGGLYRAAIKAYYETSSGGSKSYPETLGDLLEDPRSSTLRRALRRLYRDPITGNTGWGLVMTSDGRYVMGVYSLSGKKPLKSGGFASEFSHFALAQSYQGWTFQYVPN